MGFCCVFGYNNRSDQQKEGRSWISQIILRRVTMDKSAQLAIVMPIPDVTGVEELLEFLKTYGNCITLKDAERCATQKKTIVVGKILEEWKLFEDPNGEDKKVYYLESAAPGDASTYRFVVSGRRFVRLIDGVFSAGAGDYLALYEPRVMKNAGDLPTVYFPHKKATAWVCKMNRTSKAKNPLAPKLVPATITHSLNPDHVISF